MPSEIRNRIIKESLSLFCNNGIKSMTMDEIANTLGISKRTIYENFRDKDELLRECFFFNKKQLECNFQVFLTENPNPIELLVFFVVNNRKSVVNCNYRMMEELRKYHPDVFYEVITMFKNNQHKSFSHILTKGVEQGLFQENMNAEIITHFIKNGFQWVFHNTDKEISDKYSVGEIFEESLKFCVRGLVTEIGYYYYQQKIQDENFVERIKQLSL